jgi:hypothetical protein
LSEYCDNQGIQTAKLANLPSANSGIQTRVTLDNDVLPVAADSTFSFNVSFMSVGTHKLTVVYRNSSDADTLMVNLSVRPWVAPNVDLSAILPTLQTSQQP